MAGTVVSSPSGEQIAANASALQPLTPRGLSLGIVVVSVLLAIITAFVVCLRVWVRTGMSGAFNRVWKTEDYLFVLGFVPFLPSVVFAVLAAHYGVGMRDANLPSPLYAVQASKYTIYWEVHYFISSTIIKSAIGFTCVRIDRRRRVTYPIMLNIFVMVVTAVLALVFVFINCKPFAATWNPALGTCQKVITLETVSYIVSAIQAVTDWVCALVPCYIVSKLQMPKRKKISVICILGLGILASIATIIRMPYLKYYNTARYPHDSLFHVGVIMMCSHLECSLGIIACSLPPLRKLFHMYYEHWSSYKREAQRQNGDCSGTKLAPLGSRHNRLSPSGNGKWDQLEDDNSSRGIMRHTDIYINDGDNDPVLHASDVKGCRTSTP